MTEIHQILLKRADEVRRSYKDFHNNPFKEETAHKLRVNTRKLRGILNILKKAMYKADYVRLNKGLRDIALLIGELREMDVLDGLCSDIAKDKPDMSGQYQDLFFYLNKERDKKMEKTLESIERYNVENKIGNIVSKIDVLEFKKVYRDEQDLIQFISKRLKKKHQHMSDDYKVLDFDNYGDVHELRKDAKKLRFGAKYLGELTEVDYKSVSKEAKKIQDELGKITDHHINMKMLEEYADIFQDKELRELFIEMGDLEKHH